MLIVPPCRHRASEFAPGRFLCHSPRLVLPRGAAAEICARKCWCVDHPLDDDSSPPETEQGAGVTGPDGVVIGTYDSLSGQHRYGVEAVRLNLAVLRANLGFAVPVLVCDDASPPESQRQYRHVCEQYRATFISNAHRLGHTSGDMGVYFQGLLWARNQGCRTLTKLSHRMLIDCPGWLSHDARHLLSTRHATQAQMLTNFPTDQVRTECVMMVTSAWCRPEVLEFLRPRRITWWNEGHIFEAILRLVDVQRPYPGFLPWLRLSYCRGDDRPPVYFRLMQGNPHQHFHRLAEKYGIALSPGFTTQDSNQSADYLL